MLGQALVISRRESDRVLEARTLANMANIYGFQGRWGECLEAGLEAVQQGGGLDDSQSNMRARLWVANALLAIGKPDEALPHAEHMLEIAERRRDQAWIHRALIPGLSIPVAKGDWDSARETCRRIPNALAIRFNEIIGLLLGDIDASMFNYEVPEDDYSGQVTIGLVMLAAAARATGDAGLLAQLESAMYEAGKSGFLVPVRQRAADVGYAVVALGRGDKASAKRIYDSLSSKSGRQWGLIDPTGLLGLLAHALGYADQAAVHFEGAMAFCRQAGFGPELAWTYCDYADLLRERDAEGDRAKAISLLDESLSISNELGMRPLMERVLSRREILKA